ncbi:MAG: hypothetical protein OHK0037_02790 [Elainellaceae cyanobacterium]
MNREDLPNNHGKNLTRGTGLLDFVQQDEFAIAKVPKRVDFYIAFGIALKPTPNLSSVHRVR